MKSNKIIIFISLILLFSLALSLGAQQKGQQELAIDDQQVVETISSQLMRDLLLAEGFTDVEIDQDDDIIVRMNGYRLIIFVRPNEYSTILFRFAISGSNADYLTVNDWDKTRLYTRAFLDEDGDPVLEMDLDLTGGVTIARIRDAIRTYSQMHASFLVEITK
jgi:hypothetical protein